MLLAGIDIGTLTCRLLIAQVDGKSRLKTVHSDRRLLRLGEGVDREKYLNADAMARVVTTLSEWQETIQSHQVDATVVTGTSAIRDARNRPTFLQHIAKSTGITVDVLSGEEEAKRTLLGLRSGLPAQIQNFLGLDIGGGSTECMLCQDGEEPRLASVALGVVRLTEQVLHHDPPTPAEIRAAENHILDMAEATIEKIGPMKPCSLVGTAGTITTLSAIAQGLTVYHPARIHGSQLSLSTIRELEAKLLSYTQDERQTIPGLEPGRETVIVAGTIILRCFMEYLGFDSAW
ncbi:MAG: exopolyphosphatase [Nitrospirales bacterium]|nr:exopolyphosphatase [Nitrospirales bacterium]